jgi:hypothetical protein
MTPVEAECALVAAFVVANILTCAAELKKKRSLAR